MAKSPRVAIALAKARLFCLGVLALLLTLPSESRVRAVTFAFRGFQWNSLDTVSSSSWIFNRTTGCFKFFDKDSIINYSATSGRLLYPVPLQMIDPGATTVKSFSTTFIFRIESPSADSALGPGLAFIIVPDNVTLGAPEDFIGLLTSEIFATPENYESDNHTLGVELDIFRNFEFMDTSANHIGINLASMTSVYSFEPEFSLASSNVDLYKQIWLDYFQPDFRMDVFVANYTEAKPAKPQGSQSGLDLSLLRERMFAGFASANKLGSTDVPYVCAWSFSNDGIPAPPIVIGQDATPSAPPPPPDGPAAAPSLPPPASLQSPPPVPTRSPISSPSPPPASNPPPLWAPNPSLVNPSSPPPLSVPSQVPSSKPPTIAKIGGQKKNLGIYVGVPVAVRLFFVLVGLALFVFYCWLKSLGYPLRIFISHAGGPDGSGKRFPRILHDIMTKYKWSISKRNVRFFLDREDIDYGKKFATKILEELARFDVGVVVVTEAFFTSKWPMIELIAFVDAQRNDPTNKIRVIPLFYELTPKEVKDKLAKKTWESDWQRLSTDDHPLEVENCKRAVERLCDDRGFEYSYKKLDCEIEYGNEFCKLLDKILIKERSFASLIWRAKLCPHRLPSDRMTRSVEVITKSEIESTSSISK